MSNNSNNLNIPQARQGMEQFKMRSRQEVGVNLQPGYNGHLTSREAGSVGGQMVKEMYPVGRARFDRHNRIAPGHVQTVQYICRNHRLMQQPITIQITVATAAYAKYPGTGRRLGIKF